MSKTKEELLKEKYGLYKGSYKYIPAGSEILRSIGQVVILVEFKKDENGEWSNKFNRALIESISGFDPMTMTYECKYKLDGDNEETQTIKIIPEGFSWGNPEETGEMKRFVPYPMHCQMVEDEAFLARVSELYDKRETLKLDYLSNLTSSKEQDALLKYALNVGAAVRLEDGSMLWIRLHKVSLHHTAGSNYKLRFENNDRYWNMVITSDQTEYDFEGIGKFKILDLAD